jgi:PhnB protein
MKTGAKFPSALKAKQKPTNYFTVFPKEVKSKCPSPIPWGTYFGMFRDKYGIEWMIEFNSTNN